ncbi:MAG TPA: zinc-binding dehydrogenase [Acidimicrobiales bacterium]|nr:zinc-binding dehydrogenase [Acidimicrobiales bacterium]
MRACVMREHRLVVDDVADPRPELGQVLVRTVACGICGSDLHFLRHADAMSSMTDEMLPSMGELGGLVSTQIDLTRDIIMGHEFCGEILEMGPDTVGPPAGALVVSVPVLLAGGRVRQLAYNNDYPGGYAETMLLSAPLLLEVPNGLDARRAALTEPLAVGLHAVAKSGATAADAAVVVGCGPVGLAVIAGLRLIGLETVVAADFSPTRRALALTMGASVAVDPRSEPVVEAWRRIDGRRPLVAFEAVGVPGMLQELFHDVPPSTRITVVGVCMEPDQVIPFFAIAKELSVQFALAYSTDEFAGALRAIAEGDVDVAPMVTGTVDLDGVPGAFDALGHPDEQVKILVEPSST